MSPLGSPYIYIYTSNVSSCTTGFINTDVHVVWVNFLRWHLQIFSPEKHEPTTPSIALRHNHLIVTKIPIYFSALEVLRCALDKKSTSDSRRPWSPRSDQTVEDLPSPRHFQLSIFTVIGQTPCQSPPILSFVLQFQTLLILPVPFVLLQSWQRCRWVLMILLQAFDNLGHIGAPRWSLSGREVPAVLGEELSNFYCYFWEDLCPYRCNHIIWKFFSVCISTTTTHASSTSIPSFASPLEYLNWSSSCLLGGHTIIRSPQSRFFSSQIPSPYSVDLCLIIPQAS